MEARHRRIGIRGERDEPAAVVEAAEAVERVEEPDAREHPRRRGRQQHVADQPEDVGQQDRVAEAREGLVPAQVDPEQGEPDDRELGVPVRPGDEVGEDARRRGELLEGQLEDVVGRPLLERDDAPAVRESALRMAVCEPARELVCEHEAEPDRGLEGEIGVATR